MCCAIVMAGSGDLDVFRRLRKLHGRTSVDIPYGSHLAAHMAIGILFLSSGTYSLGTSNLAIAALLCALYPRFPQSISDNKHHLQPFRHFWALAVESRCLVARDVETNRPCSIPITITLRNAAELHRTAPCIIPEVSTISRISTASPQYWSIILDFENNEQHVAAFDRSQTIYVHRRSAYASTSTMFQATLQALEEAVQATNTASLSSANSRLEWLLRLGCFAGLDRSERALLLPADAGAPSQIGLDSNVVDAKVVLEKCCLDGVNADRLRNVKLVLAWVDRVGEGQGLWMGGETVDRLRAAVWGAFDEEA